MGCGMDVYGGVLGGIIACGGICGEAGWKNRTC